MAKGAERKQRMDTSSLMEQILSKDNLNAAYLQVVRNKGAAGVDGMTVEELGAYLSENGESIREQLRTRKYKPQPVRRVEIPKPDGGVRNLGVPTVVDRFVQQAVAQVLTPIFEEQFHNHSYGSLCFFRYMNSTPSTPRFYGSLCVFFRIINAFY